MNSRRTMLRMWLAFCLLCAAQAGFGEVYKCTGSNGHITFSDTPCGGKQETLDNSRTQNTDTLVIHDHQPGGGQTIKTVGGYKSPVTLQEAMDFVGRYPRYILVYFCFPPLLALFVGLIPKGRDEGGNPFRFVYSVLIYQVAVPGIFTLILLGYAIFFIHKNLLEVNFLVYFMPVISMVATLSVVSRFADINTLPGSGHLLGLLVILAIVSGIVLFIYKTRIFIGFFSSVQDLVLLALFLFVLFKWAAAKMLGNTGQ